MNTKCLLLLFCLNLIVYNSQAQKTYLYKRVLVVKNGNKTTKNDDAHFITITNKGCYESDKNGYSSNQGFVKYTKDENNIHCFYGNCSFGTAYYYFSKDYNRLNIMIDDNTTYVYQRELSGKTTASLRKKRKANNSGGSVVIPPMNMPTGTYGGSRSTTGESSSRTSTYSRCNYCNGTGVCSRCKGKCGEWMDTGYYVGDGSKSWIECSSCSGSGRCSICRGKGKL